MLAELPPPPRNIGLEEDGPLVAELARAEEDPPRKVGVIDVTEGRCELPIPRSRPVPLEAVMEKKIR